MLTASLHANPGGPVPASNRVALDNLTLGVRMHPYGLFLMGMGDHRAQLSTACLLLHGLCDTDNR